MADRTYGYYVLVVTEGAAGPVHVFGPWDTTLERDDFTYALWNGKPAREPHDTRGKRFVNFDHTIHTLYYTAVDTQTARLMNIRPVRVDDLLRGKKVFDVERFGETEEV